MIGLFNILKHINPAVSMMTVNVGSPNGYEEIVEWDASLGPPPTQAQIDVARPLAMSALALATIRAERDRRLVATDYLAMPDYPAPPIGLAVYRQSLRDFPATINTPSLLWPLDVTTLNWPVL